MLDSLFLFYSLLLFYFSFQRVISYIQDRFFWYHYVLMDLNILNVFLCIAVIIFTNVHIVSSWPLGTSSAWLLSPFNILLVFNSFLAIWHEKWLKPYLSCTISVLILEAATDDHRNTHESSWDQKHHPDDPLTWEQK